MIKALLPLAILVTTPAAAAGIGPEIAYAKGNGHGEIYLVNADNTGSRLLYRGPRRTRIFNIDIKPGGGELAFEETSCCSSGPGTIKVINYDANGSVVGAVRSLPLSCRTGSIDYHPTDGTALFRDCSDRIRRLDTTAMTSTDLGLAHNAFVASWIDATHLLYGAGGLFYKVSTDALSSPTQVVASTFIGPLDVATAGTQALSTHSTIDLIDITAGTLSPNFQAGSAGHFSPDDLYVAYITPYQKGGQYLLIRRTDGSGAPSRVGGKGTYTSLDWRN